MENATTKKMIKTKAMELFSSKGFTATTIREIAKEADCSLPMLYYYFGNKSDLFGDIVFNEYKALIERLDKDIPEELTLEEIYCYSIKQRKDLSSFDKAVYNLALKVILGFEGSKETRSKLKAIEEKRIDKNRIMLSRICDDDIILETLTDIMSQIVDRNIEKIILEDESIPDEKIINEISFILKFVKYKI